MRFLALLLVTLYSNYTFAQKNTSFLLRGNVKNFDKGYFEFGTTGFFESSRSSLMVDKEGDFSREIFIDGIQDVKVVINDELLTFPASPGDTVNLRWDQKKFHETLQLSSPSNLESKALDIALKIHKERFKPFMELREKLFTSKQLSDSARYKLINESYNAEMTIVSQAARESKYNPKPFYDTYFKHASLMQSRDLLNKFTLKTDKNNINPEFFNFNYTILSEDCFRKSALYRDFIFDWVRTGPPLQGSISNEPAGPVVFNPAKSDYQLGKANINIPLIKDWFLASSVIFSFEHYQFSDVKPLYDAYMEEGSIKSYKDTLSAFYKNISKLKPGMPAPQFTLMNVQGKPINLSDFRGKVVYIDFWGVYCGPCLGDITENAVKVHQKYKNKDVVFINVCVDATGKAWSEKIKSLNLSGINLVADGWVKNSVCIDYNIKGIPHYVLIDRQGKIVDNNAEGLWILADQDQNFLDKALEKEAEKQ